MIPANMLLEEGEIELNAGRAPLTSTVANAATGRSRSARTTIFTKSTTALQFERARRYGMRLNIAAGTAVRFEPGQRAPSNWSTLAGDRIVYGFQGKVKRALPPTQRRRRLHDTSRARPMPTCSARPPATASAWPTPI
jgi:urease subunit beta